MCGIAGIIYKDGQHVPIKYIKKMTDAIAHRGPDAEGQWIEQNVGLGHRRLSIIDLSSESNQPMYSNDKNYIITFNGEIYNYLEIKKKLEEKGIRFRTSSDTEVILEAYKMYGKRCVEEFNGMWAFCIYNIKDKKIFMSRDRFGVKPLYYLNNNNIFSFASEVKSIIEVFPEEKILNNTSIYRYLAFSKENLDELSYYKNINIFPAASYMEIDLQSNAIKIEPYWIVDLNLFREKWIKRKNPIKTFGNLFESAVMLRLRADVEVGVCLSGGLDSSAIMGCCSKKLGQKMHTFSSIYEDKSCNEQEYIEAVNKFCDAEAHYIYPDIEEKDFGSHINQINYYHDGPAVSASLYSQYMVMNGIYNHVKVVLDGQGADEMFAGYIPYYSNYIADLIDKGGMLNRFKALNSLIGVKREWPGMIGAISADLVADLVGVENCQQFESPNSMKMIRFKEKHTMFLEEFLQNISKELPQTKTLCAGKLRDQLCNDVLQNSIPALLHNEDSNSMAFSIESRTPFLDYRLVEFSIALDNKFKIRKQLTKWIVRKACMKYLPSKVTNRKSKLGFPAPFSRWIREGQSKKEIKEIIYSFGKRNIVPIETIQAFYSAHINNEIDLSGDLFKFYSLELWLRSVE